ncbi:MAG: methylenetetrahydrofolate reductase [Thermoplasmata archaeon]
MGRGTVQLKADSRLERLASDGAFVVTAEVNPPASASPERIREVANLLRGCADAYNVTDNIRAFVKMSSLAASILLLREGLEPVMQMVTRDRNRIGLQSDILGATAHGIRNVLCLRGDNPRHGGEGGTSAVEDVTPEVQIGMFRRLRDEGVLLGGERVQEPPKLYIGATSNPFGGSYEIGADILEQRVQSGADFIQTQAIYDLEGFEEFLRIVRSRNLDRRVRILGGVVPLKSQKMARFMRDKVPGIFIPDEVVERMERASHPGKEGMRICLGTLDRLQDMRGLTGVHIMPVGWEKRLREIVDGAGLYPRPGV